MTSADGLNHMSPCYLDALNRLSCRRMNAAHSLQGGGSTMVLPQRVPDADFSVVPPVISIAAERYQRFKQIEKDHLALMAQHNLLDEWSDEVRATVLDARERIKEA